MPPNFLRVITVFAENMWEAMQKSISTSAVRTSFLNPFSMWNNTTIPEAFIVFTAPAGEVLRTGAETSQNARSPILAAGTALFGNSGQSNER